MPTTDEGSQWVIRTGNERMTHNRKTAVCLDQMGLSFSSSGWACSSQATFSRRALSRVQRLRALRSPLQSYKVSNGTQNGRNPGGIHQLFGVCLQRQTRLALGATIGPFQCEVNVRKKIIYRGEKRGALQVPTFAVRWSGTDREAWRKRKPSTRLT